MSVGNLWYWIGSLTVSMALNLGLLVLLPYLTETVATMPETPKLASGIQVIRMKPPEPPMVRKKEMQPVPKPQPRQVVSSLDTPMPSIPRPRIVARHPAMEPAPQLPGLSDPVQLPPMELAGLEAGPPVPNLFSADQLDAPLMAISRVPPIYPFSARRRGVEGWVRVAFVVNEQGKVENLEIVESQPPDVFDRSVVRCVSSWRFHPGTVAAIPVKTRVETTIRFRLES